MIRSNLERLRGACDFARHARDNAGGLSAQTLADALQPQHAALYGLVIIGETLNQVSAAVKRARPTIEWRLVADLRNLIVHAYRQVDLEIIADVVANRLDPLIEQLNERITFVERAER